MKEIKPKETELKLKKSKIYAIDKQQKEEEKKEKEEKEINNEKKYNVLRKT